MEFHLISAFERDIFIWDLQDSLSLLIGVQFDKQDCNFNNWDKAIEKAINTITNTICQPLLKICKIDICYS